MGKTSLPSDCKEVLAEVVVPDRRHAAVKAVVSARSTASRSAKKGTHFLFTEVGAAVPTRRSQVFNLQSSPPAASDQHPLVLSLAKETTHRSK